MILASSLAYKHMSLSMNFIELIVPRAYRLGESSYKLMSLYCEDSFLQGLGCGYRQDPSKKGMRESSYKLMSFITKFYTVVKSPQKQVLAPVYIVKSSVTLNKGAIQKLIEMRLNPQIAHIGILRGPQSQKKCRLATTCMRI